MKPTDALRLCVYVNAGERRHGKRLYQAIVETARASNVAGASVFPVEMSYGSHRVVHDSASDYAAADVPVVIEIVDLPEPIEALLQELGSALAASLVTQKHARVVHGWPGSGSDIERSAGTLAEEHTMSLEGDANRVTIYVGSSDTWHGRNLASAIVETCRASGLAGATAARGVMGFGHQSRIHRAHLLGLSQDLPERIEIIDRPDRIAVVLPQLESMVNGGLIMIDDVKVIRAQA